MATYSLIQNGESGLSVRTTLNEIITDLNAGGGSGTSGTSGGVGTSGTSGVSGSAFTPRRFNNLSGDFKIDLYLSDIYYLGLDGDTTLSFKNPVWNRKYVFIVNANSNQLILDTINNWTCPETWGTPPVVPAENYYILNAYWAPNFNNSLWIEQSSNLLFYQNGTESITTYGGYNETFTSPENACTTFNNQGGAPSINGSIIRDNLTDEYYFNTFGNIIPDGYYLWLVDAVWYVAFFEGGYVVSFDAALNICAI